jgi:hypothetical protein
MVALPASAPGTPLRGDAINAATFNTNRGAAGVTLGMTRAQVVAKLGQPLSQSLGGAMTYATGSRIFDVYLDQGSPRRVRMIILSGKRYCTASGICMLTVGGVGDLLDQFGSRLKPKTNPDGLECYQITGRFRSRAVFTSFTVLDQKPASKFINVMILWGPPDVC